jgi:glutathione peroxidase
MRYQMLGVFMLGWAFAGGVIAKEATNDISTHTAFDYNLRAIDDSPMPLSAYKSKVLLVVNTASECGFTPQYEGLQQLWETYKSQGLVVIGVPSNDFGGQEPASNTDIKIFCDSKYHITFPMAAKEVIKGDGAHPFYLWAKNELNGKGTPSWNFHKYLIGRDGRIIDYYSSITTPMSGTLTKAVEAALQENQR